MHEGSSEHTETLSEAGDPTFLWAVTVQQAGLTVDGGYTDHINIL